MANYTTVDCLCFFDSDVSTKATNFIEKNNFFLQRCIFPIDLAKDEDKLELAEFIEAVAIGHQVDKFLQVQINV